MDINTPLSDNEYNDLNDFLMSDATGENGMDISMLDGFLTAIVSGPTMVPPSQWLALVWGKEDMAWKTTAQAEHYLSLIMRQMNTIIEVLINDPEDFEPVTYSREHEGKTIAVIDDWCAGYVMGINQDFDGWQALLDEGEHHHLLSTILLYGTEAGAEQLAANPALEAQHGQFVADLNTSVPAIYDYWAAHRKLNAAKKQCAMRSPPSAAMTPALVAVERNTKNAVDRRNSPLNPADASIRGAAYGRIRAFWTFVGLRFHSP